MSDVAGTSCEICGRAMLAGAADDETCVWCSVRDRGSDASPPAASSNPGP